MAADGYSWAADHPIVVDKFGKILALAERYNLNSTRHVFVVSNDNGATWSDPTRTSFADAVGELALTRGSIAYDSVNDLAHVCWCAAAATDGIIYRRYSFTRDGSNNITGVTRDTNVNLQLDLQTTGTMTYVHPCALWIADGGANGSLLMVWGAYNSAGTPNTTEIRATMRVLSNSVADNTAGNWVAPVTAATTGIGNAPAVAYSILDTGNVAGVMYPVIRKKTTGTFAKDVYVAYHDGNTATAKGSWKIRRMRWAAGSNNWSTGLSAVVTLCSIQIAGTDTGYAAKRELMSQITEDTTSDRMGVGVATWVSNVAGDTWSFFLVDNTDTASARVDVYSVGGAHSYAPVGDLVYDATSDRFVVSYQKTDTFAYLKTYQGTTADQVETVIYNGSRIDIPLLSELTRIAGKLLILFRDSVNTPTPPYHGYAGTMTWAASGPGGASRKGYASNPSFAAGVC